MGTGLLATLARDQVDESHIPLRDEAGNETVHDQIADYIKRYCPGDLAIAAYDGEHVAVCLWRCQDSFLEYAWEPQPVSAAIAGHRVEAHLEASAQAHHSPAGRLKFRASADCIHEGPSLLIFRPK